MLQGTYDRIIERLDGQRRAFEAAPYPPAASRRGSLRQLLALTEGHEREICQAIDADFGGRSAHETRLAELHVVRAGIRHAISKVSGWMRERRVPTSLPFWPGRNRLLPQPLGVIGIVSPWNYPFHLAVAPATAALAAGNRVMIKPSELTPAFSALLAELVARYFEPDEVSVVTGDAEVGRTFVSQRFDHLLFTGSTAVGREVAVAAAANLTPVTLELGGKSPVIFDRSRNLSEAVAKVAYAKLLNAGQTCIAPDYLMVPRGQADATARLLAAAMSKLYPDVCSNPDYTSIVNDRHYRRLGEMVAEARQAGAAVIEAGGARHPAPNARKMVPTLILNPPLHGRVMREEIFGPVLPIIEYDGVAEAIAFVNARERPLALYWFGTDREARRRVLTQTVAGGVTINDCMLHIVQERQPFGGVGASGSGAYHGEWGFRTFSKEKPVFLQSRYSAGALLRPPYGQKFERAFTLLRLMS